MLRYSFLSKDASTKKARKQILDESGKRFSAMDELVGWSPVSSSAVDFMHNFYGIAKYMFSTLLIDGYLLDTKRWRSLQAVVNSIQWPSCVGRLPNNLGENRGLPKADQWRRWVNIQTTVLWCVWRDENDKLAGSEASPIPHNASKRPTFTRDISRIYRLFLYASIAERILASRQITLDDVKRGHGFIQDLCLFYERFGPVYAWWLFAHERFNGILADVNLNGRPWGEMELTLMRNWQYKLRLYELVSTLPPDATEYERAELKSICREQGAVRGTLGTQIEAFAHGASTINTPRRSSKTFINLRQLEDGRLYLPLLYHLRRVFPHLTIGDEHDLRPHDTTFLAHKGTQRFPFISKDAIRYGSTADTRTDSDQHACVDFDGIKRIPCRIRYHFEIELVGQAPRMVAGEDIPTFPWSMYCLLTLPQLRSSSITQSRSFQRPGLLPQWRSYQSRPILGLDHWVAPEYPATGVHINDNIHRYWRSDKLI
ncbi:uncharacterized protein BXZ73DRAFT_93026 [Epithele typhae]|uniref:uncharacterized protein n=1 Tax=Epithele typhae TaxID=378194 RepID=UPI00200753EB|nr:uncharacterized protein BXZ73DRAFT_93026 [Epithele typhae]KAH9913001.1 hypothetical protein BXZ73DRAFT_93026 [Epithele typhae]